MESADKRGRQKRGVVLAAGGLLLALLVGLAVRELGLTAFTFRHWLVLLGLTLGLEGLLWFLAHWGWSERMRWDQHYIYLPTLVAAFLLSLYTYVAPELRVIVLMVWFVNLLFMAGLAGALPVVLLSAAMALGYFIALTANATRGTKISLPFEATVAGVFWLICGYAGVLFERLRRTREETRAFRRQLSDLALTDALTGLPNRRMFEQALQTELARVARYGGSCCVAMIDVDYFKNYNDMLGHLAGDRLLRELARVVRKHMRVGDGVGRYGGEEFTLIMPNTSKAEGAEVLDRLRVIIEDHSFPSREVQPSRRLTISAGIAGCPEDGSEYEGLLQKADEALYAAKRNGRNRVQIAA